MGFYLNKVTIQRYYRNFVYYNTIKMAMKSALSAGIKTSRNVAVSNQIRALSASSVLSQNVQKWRESFPIIDQNKEWIFADGGAGTQVASNVITAMKDYLGNIGSTNVGGNYHTSTGAVDFAPQARSTGKDLLGTTSNGEIAFGKNCTDLMFNLVRSIENFVRLDELANGTDTRIRPGDNIVLSRACHDANVTPWLLMARNLDLEVRWIECLGSRSTKASEDDAVRDALDIDSIPSVIDDRTRLISVGLASNVTGRIHFSAIEKIREVFDSGLEFNGHKPFLILDGTHFVPHRRTNLAELGGDAVINSSYKYFGPHLGIMGFNAERFDPLKPAKVGVRYAGRQVQRDFLIVDNVPTPEECETSRWELGTSNYPGLAGFEACVNYLAGINGEDGNTSRSRSQLLDLSFARIRQHEEDLTERFLVGIQDLLSENKIRLLGSRKPSERTPTFALTTNKTSSASDDCYDLVKFLNEKHIYCMHSNHYAPELVDNALKEPEGVTRLSLLHYNTNGEVDRIVSALHDYVKK